jgi:hypothetical protein
MRAARRALLLLGSPKGPRSRRSTSSSLGTYLLGRLRELGLDTRRLHLDLAGYRSAGGRERLCAAVAEGDVVVLAAPLYVDSLPGHVIRGLEILAASSDPHPERRRSLTAIVNCSFPDAARADGALTTCRLFARECGFTWAGGLGLGMGDVIGGRALSRMGGLADHVRRALEMVAGSLAEGRAVPAAAVELMAKPLVAPWVFLWGGQLSWYIKALRGPGTRSLAARPYERCRPDGGE